MTTAPATENLRVRGCLPLITPAAIKRALPAHAKALECVRTGRQTIQSILNGNDPRLLVIVGPCSIHDPGAALDYAYRLVTLNREVRHRLFLVMRVYFEKPRSTIGWKGLINDPFLDQTFAVEAGLQRARRLLLDITNLGIPTATEFLDPIVPQYLADLICWAAIGARTTESQTHREMASGLSMPVGFKNGTDGSVQTAIDAMRASRTPHSFIGIDPEGRTSVIQTAGNPDCHVVLRGGRQGPNYHPEATQDVARQLQKAGLPPRLMIDCSHANSGKNPDRQPEVWASLLKQRRDHHPAPIIGAMLESFLLPGSQPIPRDRNQLRYGVSITDDCLGWETTETMLRNGSAAEPA